MNIDIHVHLKTENHAVWQDELKQFVKACEANETRACLLGGSRRIIGFSNDEVLTACKEYKDYLIPFAMVDLWAKNISPPSIIAQYKEQGFKGLKCIMPYYPYDHDSYMPIYEAAEQLEMPIVFHTGVIFQHSYDTVSKRPSLRNMEPLTMDRIARSFQKLKIVMAHMGTTMFREQAAELLKFHPNLYADLAGTGSWYELQPSRLLELSKPTAAEFDPEMKFFRKLVLGSDAYTCFPDMINRSNRGHEELFARINLPKPIIDDIMGKTVASWLK
jgi:predicted TIM-barrel fold metal-dependent hydrolase